MKLLHGNADVRVLGVVRLWVFGIWFVKVALDPYYLFAEIPRSVLRPIGLLKLMPVSLWDRVITEPVLVATRVVTLLLVLGASLGVRPYRMTAISAAVLLVFYQTLIRSLGHYNHAELGLLYCAIVLAIFPSADGFAWGRWGRGQVVRGAAYSGAMVLMTLLLAMTYCNIAAYRLAHSAPSIFMNESMGAWFAWFLRDTGVWGSDAGLWVLRRPWVLVLVNTGFAVTTVFEFLTPLCLFWRGFRIAWLMVIVPFHFSTLVLMDIFFWENLLLLMVLMIDISGFRWLRVWGDGGRLLSAGGGEPVGVAGV